MFDVELIIHHNNSHAIFHLVESAAWIIWRHNASIVWMNKPQDIDDNSIPPVASFYITTPFPIYRQNVW